MRRLTILHFPRIAAAVATLVLATAAANAAEYCLYAGATSKTLPGGASVPMWGFALEADCDFTTLEGSVQVPGPELVVPDGDTTLTIHLHNDGIAGVEGVSIVAPGQAMPDVDGSPAAPERFNDPQGRSRVRSFTATVAAGSTRIYSWANLKPGTFLYQSGTHPAVQVQMGLYGALVVAAYPGVSASGAATILYSEIDPALHAAVDDGTYGTPPAPTSTLDYHPTWFLVNGEPYTAGAGPAAVAATNQPFHLRLLNAGLMTHVPTLLGGSLKLIAEDGNLYPYPRTQYSVLLPAGKTIDVIWTPTTVGAYPLVDRTHHLTNDGAADGGMLAFLQADPGPAAPTASNDAYTVDEDGSLVAVAGGIPPLQGILDNDTSLGNPLAAVLASAPTHGSLSLSANGSFTYTPFANYSGADSYQYRAQDTVSGVLSNAATVGILVTAVNDAPVTVADAASTVESTPVTIWVLTNDQDLDHDVLSVGTIGPAAHGVVVNNGDGSLTYTRTDVFIGDDTFSYAAADAGGDGSPATVTVTIIANQPPIAVNDFATTKKNVAITFSLVANDTDDLGLDPTSVVITVQPTRGGTVVNYHNGTIQYTPKNNFRGTDVFYYTVKDIYGLTSNQAKISVNVTK